MDIGTDGSVWGVKTGGGIFRWNMGGSWDVVPGHAIQGMCQGISLRVIAPFYAFISSCSVCGRRQQCLGSYSRWAVVQSVALHLPILLSPLHFLGAHHMHRWLRLPMDWAGLDEDTGA
jgi:hypothetical protein